MGDCKHKYFNWREVNLGARNLSLNIIYGRNVKKTFLIPAECLTECYIITLKIELHYELVTKDILASAKVFG